MHSLEERNISLGLKIKILFGHPLTLIGTFFFILGSFILILSIPTFSLKQSISTDNPKTDAVIVKMNKTSIKINNRRVYEYQYNYLAPDGKKYSGTSYTEEIYSPGDQLKVYYLSEKMNMSRLEGMRDSIAPIEFIFIIPIFPILGLIFILVSMPRRLKILKLLRYGVLASGQLVSKEKTNVRINNQPQYKITFQFSIQGKNYKVDAFSHTPNRLEDEAQEMLIYDPQNPEKAVLVDELPKSVKNFLRPLKNLET